MATPRPARIGNLRAAARLMRTLDGQPGQSSTGIAQKRRLVAELCRMLDPQTGVVGAGQVTGAAANRFARAEGGPNGKGHGNGNGGHNGKKRAGGGARAGANGHAGADGGAGPLDMSPRMRQTLDRLLAGDSEKQIAARFGRSRHTVHVYVKKLYLRFGVSSRGELFSHFVHARTGAGIP